MLINSEFHTQRAYSTTTRIKTMGSDILGLNQNAQRAYSTTTRIKTKLLGLT